MRARAGFIRIDGGVPSGERQALVDKFQSDPATRVAVLSLTAAGQVNQQKGLCSPRAAELDCGKEANAEAEAHDVVRLGLFLIVRAS